MSSYIVKNEFESTLVYTKTDFILVICIKHFHRCYNEKCKENQI